MWVHQRVGPFLYTLWVCIPSGVMAAPFQVLQNQSIAPSVNPGVLAQLHQLNQQPTQLYIHRQDDQLYTKQGDTKSQSLTTQTFKQGLIVNNANQPWVLDGALKSSQASRYRYESDTRSALWTTSYEAKIPSVILGKGALSVFNLDQGERRVHGFHLKVHPVMQLWGGQVQSQIRQNSFEYVIDESHFYTALPDVKDGFSAGVQIQWKGLVRGAQEYLAGERTQRLELTLGDWGLNWVKRTSNRADLQGDVRVNGDVQGEWSGLENELHQEVRLNYRGWLRNDFYIRVGEYQYQANADMVVNKQALDFPWVSFLVRDAVGQFQGQVKQTYIGTNYQTQWNSNWRFGLGVDWVRVETKPYQFDYWLRLFPFGQAGADSEKLEWISSDWIVLSPSLQYASKNWALRYGIRQLIPYRTDERQKVSNEDGEIGSNVSEQGDNPSDSDGLFKRGFLHHVSFVYRF